MKAFVVVVEEGGFSRAVKALKQSKAFQTEQSTLSKAVKKLREEVGFPLFERVRPEIALTPGGKLVYDWARRMLTQHDQLPTLLAGLDGLQTGSLRLGLPAIGSGTLFARWFAKYRTQYPGVKVELMERGSKDLEDLVLDGKLDLAATLWPVPKEFSFHRVWREPIDVLVSKGHRLASSKQVDFKALAAESFILYSPGFALNPMILAACQKNGFAPTVVAESRQIDFVIELVAANLGIAFVPRMIAEQRAHPQTRHIPVAKPAIDWEVALIWLKDTGLSRTAKAWLELNPALPTQ